MSGILACRTAVLVGVILASGSAACATGPAQVGGDDSGNALRGLAYARQTCVLCHAVEANDLASKDMNAPPFATIANMPGLTHRAFDVWLHSEHEHMPNFVVEADRVDDIYAYLRTLKSPPPH